MKLIIIDDVNLGFSCYNIGYNEVEMAFCVMLQDIGNGSNMFSHSLGRPSRRDFVQSRFVCEKPVNKRMLICIACGNGSIEYRIELSKTRRQRLC